MGFYGKSSSSNNFNGNPDPNNYKVLDVEQIKDFLLVKINYPDCKNFEGNKILLFENTTPIDLWKQKVIDPHFSNNSKIKSPVARFEPTERGWFMAQQLARNLAIKS